MDYLLIYMETSLLSKEKENETLAHRFHMDIFQNGKLKVADEIVSSNFVLHNPVLPSELKNGLEGVKKFASAIIDTMPDRQFTHEDVIVKENMVLIRWNLTGTITKELFAIMPSDKPVIITGFDLIKITDGKILEMWQQYNFGTWL
jgi:predicted SnoaL-like aldol condensation-catalyzing enzyme